MRPSIKNQKTVYFLLPLSIFHDRSLNFSGIVLHEYNFQNMHYCQIFRFCRKVPFFQPAAKLYNFETDFCDIAVQLDQDLIKCTLIV